MPGTELVAAVGRHEEQALLAHHADEERQQVQGGGIHPVDVLDDHHDRSVPGQPVESTEHVLEQSGPRELAGRPGRASELRWRCGRQQAREVPLARTEQLVQLAWAQLPGQRSERIDDGAIGEAATTQLDAPPEQDLRPIAHPGDELLHQARLADSRLAGDEQQAGGSMDRCGQCGGEACQLPLPGDEARARGTEVQRDRTDGHHCRGQLACLLGPQSRASADRSGSIRL
jgi:hypothetical protein